MNTKLPHLVRALLIILIGIFFGCNKKEAPSALQEVLLNRKILDSAYLAKQKKDTSLFKRLNKKGLDLSIKSKDTFAIADAYWNYGSFHSSKEQLDSSYYYFDLAFKGFNKIQHNFNAGKMLYNMAVIQKNLNDFTGSEITTSQSISKFDKEKHHYNLYLSYNNLGVIYYNLNEFEKSIESHNKALDYLKKVKNKRSFKEGSLNNIGITHQKNQDYKKAISYFEEALSNDSLKYKNHRLYIRLLDNLAYNKLLHGDTLNVHKALLKPLQLRDSMNNTSGVAISKLHLSEYYAFKQDTTKAITFAQDAHDLAKSVDNHRDELSALQLLSNLDLKNSGNYLAKYVQLNDSLQVEERSIRNKFTRISFETDEYIEQTEKLSRDNLLITIISISTLLLLGSIFIIRLQRAKNKRLLLEQEQQNDREQIYQLMIDQQSKLEEGRSSERTRISEELHDGILGSMYGTRMGLGFLEIEGNNAAKIKLEEYLNEMLQIEKEVRAVSHALQSKILNSQSNFVNTIETYLEKVNQNNNLIISLNNDETIIWDKVSSEIKINLFRIIQETYYNTLKHAKANNFILSFSLNNEFIKLVIEDDGIGFNINKTKKGIGIKNMQNRIEHLQGNIKIDSSPNSGTKVGVLLKQ